MCEIWDPVQLMQEHKTECKETEAITCYKATGKASMSQIFTGDETWIYHLESDTKDSQSSGVNLEEV